MITDMGPETHTGRKGIRPVTSTTTTVFLAHHDSVVATCWLQVWTLEHCHCHRRDVLLKPSHLPQCSWPILAVWSQHAVPVRNTVILQCFDALVGRQERHPTCKSSAITIARSLLLGVGLTWSNWTWSNSGKLGRLNKKQRWYWIISYGSQVNYSETCR